MEELQDEIEDLLQAHGLTTSRYNQWILINDGMPAIRGEVFNVRQVEGRVSLQLDIQMAVDTDVVIIESFAGVGSSEQEARDDAVMNFSWNSLHVLLAAFCDTIDEAQTSIELWEIDGTRWRVVLGNFGVRAGDNVEVPIPDDAFPTLEAQVRSLKLDGDLYWVRMFLANAGAEKQVAEVLLNNEAWPEAQKAIESLKWPKIDDYYSVRNFLVLQRWEGEIQGKRQKAKG